MWKTTRFSVFAVVVTLLLLCGAGYDRMQTPSSEGADEYLRSVRDASEALPLRIASWVGKEIPLPPAAITLLRPNVLLSREYTDMLEGRRASFLLVQCADARDMQGHYPPVCYPNSGWREVSRERRDWQVNGRRIAGVAYAFEGQPLSGRSTIVIYNTLALPGEGFVADMDAVRQRAAQAEARLWGAGQIQVIFDGSVAVAQRDEVFESLLEAHEPLLAAMLNDVNATDPRPEQERKRTP